MLNNWPTAAEGRIPTKNQKGFMFLDINGASTIFLKDISDYKGTVMDLGCAYGVVTLPALKASTANIIAFDLAQEHLDILTAATSEQDKKRIYPSKGYFPDEFAFSPDTLDAIHSAYVLHFLTGKELLAGLQKCFSALKPGGKIYINTLSIYFKPLAAIHAEITKKMAEKKEWPGEITNFRDYIPSQDVPFAPNYFHLHELEALKGVFEQTGFLVETAFYFDMAEPTWYASNNKGIIALVAQKPFE